MTTNFKELFSLETTLGENFQADSYDLCPMLYVMFQLKNFTVIQIISLVEVRERDNAFFSKSSLL